MTVRTRRRRPLVSRAATLAASLVALVVSAAPLAADDGPPVDGAALFATHCARCHGAQGAGDGPENVNLDRPARSFAAGGFSFGDTHEAIRRTLETGIPGSPMPAFGEALSPAERDALASHVRTLIPERRRVETDETELVVGDVSALARGHLAPLSDGARAFPRGLVVGTPQGLSFVFRADDLRLLAVTQGRFVRRTDWTGRGGTPLELLGRTLWLHEGGDPERRWFVERDGTEWPLRVALRGTDLRDDHVRLEAQLLDAERRVVGDVVLSVGSVSTPEGSGFTLAWGVQARDDAALVLRWRPPAGSAQLGGQGMSAGLSGGPCHGPGLLYQTRLLRDADAALPTLYRWSGDNHVGTPEGVELRTNADANGVTRNDDLVSRELRFLFGGAPRTPTCEPTGEQLLREDVLFMSTDIGGDHSALGTPADSVTLGGEGR